MTAVRSTVPTGYAASNTKGEPYTSVARVLFPRYFSNLDGRVFVQIAPEIAPPMAEPTLYAAR